MAISQMAVHATYSKRVFIALYIITRQSKQGTIIKYINQAGSRQSERVACAVYIMVRNYG